MRTHRLFLEVYLQFEEDENMSTELIDDTYRTLIDSKLREGDYNIVSVQIF